MNFKRYQIIAYGDVKVEKVIKFNFDDVQTLKNFISELFTIGLLRND